MCNAGHFKSRTALLTRTNRIWPIAYHTTSPQVIAQAYYDVLDKEVDESITLEEFHSAAAHWGKVGRYNLWYYAPEYQGQGDKISGAQKLKLKWGERIARFCYNWTGVPTWLSTYISNTPNGKLNLHYLDLQERFIQTKLADPKKEFVTNIYQTHLNYHGNLSHFSSHSRNVITELLGEASGGKKKWEKKMAEGKKEKEKAGAESVESEPHVVADIAPTTAPVESPAAVTVAVTDAVVVVADKDVVEVAGEDAGVAAVAGAGKEGKKEKKKRKKTKGSDAESTEVAIPSVPIQIEATPAADV